MNDLKTAQKLQIVQALVKARSNFGGNDKKFAESHGINPSVYNQLKNGKDFEKLLDISKWITIARKLDVPLGNQLIWKAAITEVYTMINEQLNFCADNAISIVYCDDADTGKTFAAKDNIKRFKNRIYVDCSLHKTKQLLIRKIASEFGLDSAGKYNDVKNDLCYYLKTLENPLVILDEFGDLDYNAFLEIKALWNGTEGACGWYAIGADGLKVKLDRGRNYKKVGYTEFYRRFGSKYQKATPMGKDDKEQFTLRALVAVAKANCNTVADVQAIVKGSNGSLTRVKTEIQKRQKKN